MFNVRIIDFFMVCKDIACVRLGALKRSVYAGILTDYFESRVGVSLLP